MRIQSNMYYSIPSLAYKNTAKPSSDEKKSNKYNLTSTATLAIASAAAVLLFSKGTQKAIGKYLYKSKDFLEKKLEPSANNDGNNKKQTLELFIRKFNSFIKKTESVNNIISLKDILFMKFMFSTTPTKKIHQGITKYFEDLSRKTIAKSYTKAENNFNKIFSAFDKLDEEIIKISPDETIQYKGKKHTKKQLIDMAKDYRETAKVSIEVFTSKSAQNARFEHIKETTSTLYTKFWDASFKDFWSKNNRFKRKEMWQTFIAAEQVKGDKADLAEKVDVARNIVTYDSADKIKILLTYINELEKFLTPQDNNSFDTISKLKQFLRNPEFLQNDKSTFLQELEKLKDAKSIDTSDKNILQTQKNNIEKYIDLTKNILNESYKGILEDMLEIYYKLAPEELSKSGAEKALKKAVSSFNNAVELETVEFFDKERDLVLGSAPTDILTILFSGCAISYGLGFAKDKDERISILLKSGIPVVGAILTTLISATKLVSGTKSIVLGLISGLALNSIGSLTDNLIKQNKNG